MDQQTLEKRLAGLSLPEIRCFKTLNSTNETAAEWALKDASDYSLVIADQQEKGKGRAGRKWFTIPGAALAFSLIIRPTPQEQLQSAFLVSRFTGLGAVGVSQTIQNQYGLPAKIKWPNDILINQRKVCGVLAEAQWVGDQLSAVILGIGINIATNAVPWDCVLNFPATSLEAESGSSQDRLAVLYHVLAEIQRWRFGLMGEEFLRTWEAGLAYLGEWVRLMKPSEKGCPDTVLVEGTVIGLAPDGALRLRTGSGEERTYRSGEIPTTSFSPTFHSELDFQSDAELHLRPVDSSTK